MRVFLGQNFKRFYIIGIAGTGMSALAICLKRSGMIVCGSDRAASAEMLKRLAANGIAVFPIHKAENLGDAQVVVYSDGISEENAELRAARLSGRLVLSRTDLLKIIAGNFRHVVTVAGSHGKTTATAMLAHCLGSCGAEFSAYIGGWDRTFGNFYSSGKNFFVTESCEYKKNLLRLNGETAVLLNVDKDHMDCYHSFSELRECFYTYAERAQTAVLCADDPYISEALCCHRLHGITYGLENADYVAYDLVQKEGRYSFQVSEQGTPLCAVRLRIPGRSNVYNALSAVAVMRRYGFCAEDVANGLEAFQGVERRFEKIGERNGAAWVADYAHHPKEIESALETAKSLCKGELYVLFEPHTYSRTATLLYEFAESLSSVQNLAILPVYAAREYYAGKGDASDLVQLLPQSEYIETDEELRNFLARAGEGDMCLFLGAGSIYGRAKRELSL